MDKWRDHSRPIIRPASIVNPRSSATDIELLVEAVRQIGGELVA